MRIRLPLVGLVIAAVAQAAEPTPPPAPEARYADEKLTVRATDAPLPDVLDAIKRATGAEVRGTPAEAPPVTVTLEAIPVKDALSRILGDQSFTLTYAEDGALRVIDLRGGPSTAPVKRPAVEPDTSVSGLPDGIDRAAADVLAAWIESKDEHPITGDLADQLGANARVAEIIDTAIAGKDARVRGQALRTALRLLERDQTVRDAFVQLLASVDDTFLVRYAQLSMKDNALEVVTGVARQSTTPAIRVRAQNLLAPLRAAKPPS